MRISRLMLLLILGTLNTTWLYAQPEEYPTVSPPDNLPRWATFIFEIEMDVVATIPYFQNILNEESIWGPVTSLGDRIGFPFTTGTITGGIRTASHTVSERMPELVIRWYLSYDRLELAKEFHRTYPNRLTTTTFEWVPVYQIDEGSYRIILDEHYLGVASDNKYEEAIQVHHGAYGGVELNTTLYHPTEFLMEACFIMMTSIWDSQVEEYIHKQLEALGVTPLPDVFRIPYFLSMGVGMEQAETGYRFHFVLQYKDRFNPAAIKLGLEHVQQQMRRILEELPEPTGQIFPFNKPLLTHLSQMDISIDTDNQLIHLERMLDLKEFDQLLRQLFTNTW